MRLLSSAIIGAGLALAATPAYADILKVTYAGTVASGMDLTGVFGLAGKSLAGLPYVVVYRFDDALGERTTLPPYLDSVIGGKTSGTASPSLGALLTVNGISFSFDGSGLGLQSNFPLGGAISSYASDSASGGAFDASFVGESLSADGVPTSMDEPYMASGTAATGGFTNTFQIAFGPNGLSEQNAVGSLSPATVLVDVEAAVPEPSTWITMIVGFGIIGVAMRRRSQARVRVAIV